MMIDMAAFNHIGHVVTDLDRAKRFYVDVLGFELWYEIRPPDDATAKLSSLTPPLGLTASYLTLDGFVLELLHYAAPDAAAPARERTMNEPGLTHLSVAVDDVHETANIAVELGGSIIETSDIGNAMFIRDPDGQLVELLPSLYRDGLPPKP
jgi:catechol 2,3-dioxygenase-like lactoylglutathione lyase family enzyme